MKLVRNNRSRLTIIFAGSSGGAGRDMGVFERNETVFSVSIAMGDAGDGPDWPMRYSLKTHAQSEAVCWCRY